MQSIFKHNAAVLLAAAAGLFNQNGALRAGLVRDVAIAALAPRARYRGPTSSRRAGVFRSKGGAPAPKLAKYARNYAVRYMTKPAIIVAREELARQAQIAQRSGDAVRARRLSDASVTYPR